jgi:hypothetical protein
MYYEYPHTHVLREVFMIDSYNLECRDKNIFSILWVILAEVFNIQPRSYRVSTPLSLSPQPKQSLSPSKKGMKNEK